MEEGGGRRVSQKRCDGMEAEEAMMSLLSLKMGGSKDKECR